MEELRFEMVSMGWILGLAPHQRDRVGSTQYIANIDEESWRTGRRLV